MPKRTEGSLTARMTAAWRAEESEKPEGNRLFVDPYAGYFAGEEGRRFAASMRDLIPGHRQMILLRTRYIDDFLQKARSEGIVQVVLLGAGYDCRALRLESLKGARVFEVDHPATQESKVATLTARLGSLPPGVVYVPADLEEAGLSGLLEKLGAQGYRRNERSVCVLEGVLQYLRESAVKDVLRLVPDGAGRGSRMIFNCFPPQEEAGPEGQQAAQETAQIGEPLKWGLRPDQIEGFLGGLGFVRWQILPVEQIKLQYRQEGLIDSSFALEDGTLGRFARDYRLVEAGT